MSKRSVVKVVGPLAPYASGFGRELRNRGYADLSIDEHLRLVAHVSRWLTAMGLEAEDFTSERVAAFVADRRLEGYTSRRTVRAVEPLRGFLQSQGVLPPSPTHEPETAHDQLLARYRNYLVCERALVKGVVSKWVQVAAEFLADHPELVDGKSGIAAADVSAFCVRVFPLQKPSSASITAASLRTFLRFLHVEGLVEAPLAQAVPRVASRKNTGLVRAVPPAALTRMLASCDRRTKRGRRDYAIMVTLARLGLRAGEVARLSLDDIDWRNAEMVVHGKGGRDERLPLPADVGAAIAGYLRRGRPQCDSRTVFLRAIAPTVGLNPSAVSWVVYSACQRAGMPRVSAHQLRHGAATEMLRQGASLTEVGQVLRHATVGTTAIYAKVDFVALRPLALPWPGGAA